MFPRVIAADGLFQNARVEFVELLLAQRDLLDVRMDLIPTKLQQVAAIICPHRALEGKGSPTAAVEHGLNPVLPAPADGPLPSLRPKSKASPNKPIL